MQRTQAGRRVKELGQQLAGWLHPFPLTLCALYTYSVPCRHCRGLPLPLPAGEMVQEVDAALTWAFDNVWRYGGDPHQMTAAGHSAGGHLLAWALLRRAMALHDDAGEQPVMVAGREHSEASQQQQEGRVDPNRAACQAPQGRQRQQQRHSEHVVPAGDRVPLQSADDAAAERAAQQEPQGSAHGDARCGARDVGRGHGGKGRGVGSGGGGAGDDGSSGGSAGCCQAPYLNAGKPWLRSPPPAARDW